MAIGLKFPFEDSFEGGVFKFTKTTPDKVRTDLIALLTTKRRQRLMHNNLFSPLWDYVFEPWDEISADKLKTELLNTISTFMPEIIVQDIVFSFDEATLILTTQVIYSIVELAGLTNTVVIDVAIQPAD
jgi:hypothetical protein